MEVASKTAVAATLSEEQVAISKRLNAWAEAWRTKNIAQYLGFYSNQFRPEGITNKAWVAQRQQRLAKPGPINLTIENVSVRVDGSVASARFIQTYSANGYSDRVSKLIVFEQQNAEWRIVKESVVAKVDGILPSTLESNQISEPLEAGKPRDVTLDEKSEGPPVRKQAPAVQAAPPEPEEVAEEQPASETQMPDEAVDAKPVSKPVEKTKDQAVEKPAEKPVVKPVTKVPSKAGEKNDSNKSKPLSEEDEPGYFDRILEKIGF
jgi:ketosteroid isomerase-like protein